MTPAKGRVTVTEDHAQIEFERTIRAPIAEVWQALTDPAAQDLRKTIPTRVPSGLPLAETR